MRATFPFLAALLSLAGCAGGPPPAHVAPAVPKTYQWLQGSGEAAVLSAQAYRAMAARVLALQARRARGEAVADAVLAAGATPGAPRWSDCGARPSAVILDIDETSILNTGANYDSARRGDPPFDPARWAEWERTGAAEVDPLPGAVAALAAMRAAGVTPVFISNRQQRFAAQAAAALAGAGLGPAEHGRTLFTLDDVAPGSGKDPRRAFVAARWCVLAMAGDQLGDFSDLFNARSLSVQARRTLAQSPALAGVWGKRWFLMPNPAYGPGVAGTLDDLFAPDRRWAGPAR